ncbi:MAG: hypothetical protein KC553_13965, partial [Nitrospina sp.]|nr:hypothetical protein [Nitrospina sp.]
LDSRGKILRAFHTVIDPCRSLPPCRTHSLTEDDIKEAPKFGEIAGDVVDFLAEAVIISHNVIFNRLFIKEEFKRLGHALPALPSICTLELARQLVPEPRSRRLPDVCLELGLSYGGRHNALEEARATRLVFLQALNQLQIKSVKDLGITGTPPPRSAWPAITPSGRYTQQPSPPEKPPAQSTAATLSAETGATALVRQPLHTGAGSVPDFARPDSGRPDHHRRGNRRHGQHGPGTPPHPGSNLPGAPDLSQGTVHRRLARRQGHAGRKKGPGGSAETAFAVPAGLRQPHGRGQKGIRRRQTPGGLCRVQGKNPGHGRLHRGFPKVQGPGHGSLGAVRPVAGHRSRAGGTQPVGA